jgi:apolipoprotein N-acyltransferase
VIFGRLLATVLGAALCGLPFVDPRFGPVAFVGLAPALVVLARRDGRSGWRGRLGWSLLLSLILTYLGALPLARAGISAMVVMGGFLTPFLLAGLLLFCWLRRRTGWPVAALWPSCWLLAEWGWSFYSVSETAVGLGGYTQFRWPAFIQIADLTGVLGVGFLVQLVVGALADLGLGLTDGAGTWRRPRTWAPLAVASLLVVADLGYGSYRLATARPGRGPRLAMVQPAIDHGLDEATMRLVQYRQVGLAREQIEPGEVDLVAFPENAVLKQLAGSEYLDEFQALAADLRTPLLVGAITPPPGPRAGVHVYAREYFPAYNSAVIVTALGMGEKYDKIALLPFSERLPFADFFAALGLLDGYRRFVVGNQGYLPTAVPGPAVRLLRIPGRDFPPFWTPICFEQANSRLSRQAARQGARFFVNITSEGRLGPQIYWNNMAVCTLRAVEHRLAIARAGNMGITAVIDPWGRTTALLVGSRQGQPWGEGGVLQAEVPLGPDERPLFTRLGDWPVGAAVLVVLVAVVAGRGRSAAPTRPGSPA